MDTVQWACCGELNEKRMAMSGKMDQVKGRVKEVVGVLTDDESLKRERQLDQIK
jgi:uncharacterized protein YjbJ (UPF0337 family)